MKKQLYNILNSKKLVVNTIFIKIALESKLSLNEFLVLIFFDNNFNDNFDIELVSNTIGLNINETMEAFNSLMMKGLVSLESVKDRENRLIERVKLDEFYNSILEKNAIATKEESTEDIFKVFEKELGRTMSSMELEIINGWLMSGTSEELILGALKEAVYNGVTKFRYIDKIIYEWEKKGFKNMNDVKKHLQSRREDKNKEKVISKKERAILDYDWLDG